MLAPAILASAAAIKLHDRGPVFFRQTRVGRNGERFACLKFRTMVVDAEGLLAQLHADTGYSTGLFKMQDDPRITKPGRLAPSFLGRRGPPAGERPARRDEPRRPTPAAARSKWPSTTTATSRRLRVRPGLTGLWQVSGRSDLSWEEAIRLDLYYVDNWSALQDLSILFKTVAAVLRPRGAY